MNELSMPRRVLPAVGLFLIAPLVAEWLLGDLPITMLAAMVLMAPLYGGGALLIRETTRRLGRGVPTMLLLGLAYGVLEEGVLTLSLFNPDYAGAHLLDEGFVPALGIAGPWTVFVLTLHAVWSTTVPIVLVEALVPARRTTPWLGRVGLAVVAVLFLLGSVATAVQQRVIFPYAASLPQLVSTVVVAAVLVALALRLPRWPESTGPVPAPLVLGGIALVAASAFLIGAKALGWLGAIGALLVAVALAVLVLRWSKRPGWTPLHTSALGVGALGAYAWHVFVMEPIIPTSPTIDLVGDVVLAAGAIAMATLAIRRTRRATRTGAAVVA